LELGLRAAEARKSACAFAFNEGLQRLPDERRFFGKSSEILGFDPLYVANEGKLLAFAPPDQAAAVLAAIRTHPLGRDAVVIGEVVDDHPGIVVLETLIGGERIIDMPLGEQLPRIC